MLVRLAFSVAVQVDAEILLMDEVLAVGDASFQRKCFDEFSRLKSEGRTIIFVTHDMNAIEKFCDRAMLLERGRVVDIGASDSIARQYNDLNFKRARRQTFEEQQSADQNVQEPVAAAAQITGAAFESDDGETTVALEQGKPCTVRVEALINAPLDDPVFAISLRNEYGMNTFGANTQLHQRTTGHFAPGDHVTVRLKFDNWLAPSRYTLIASIQAPGVVGEMLDVREDLASLIVHAPETGGGIVDLPYSIEIERT
jgi:ABC-type glutathione transport system ATPase component